MDRVLGGIDEAGRGCVLGPMVIAGFSIPESKEHLLRKMGVKDSKLLSPARREKLAGQLESLGSVFVIKVGPCKIDNYMRDGVNLNKLEAMKFGEIANLMGADRLVVDCPDGNTDRFRAFLEKVTDRGEVVAEHKADLNHPVVAAASICAKVERDRAITELAEENGNIGSGYSSDQVTMEWLRGYVKDNSKLPDFARKHWLTSMNLMAEKEQSKLDSFLGLLKGDGAVAKG